MPAPGPPPAGPEVHPLARRRKDPDEAAGRGFEFPEFDDEEMIRKEVVGFRSSLVLLIWAIITAGVSFAIWLVAPSPRTGWYIGLLIAAGMGYLLRYLLPRFHVDTSGFGRKEWFGTGALFFFAWLAFFILITNPPLYDGVAPDVEIHVTPAAQVPGHPVNVTVVATDNVRVDPGSVRFLLLAPDGATLASESDLEPTGHPSVWSLRFTPTAAGEYSLEAAASDVRGGLIPSGPREREVIEPLRAGDVLQVRMTGEGQWATPEDRVTVELPAQLDVYRAWLAIAGDGQVLLARDTDRSDEERQIFYATPDFQGFQAGTNNFTVHVEEHDSYFLPAKYGIPPIRAPLVSNETFTVTVPAGLLGQHVPELPEQRDPAVQPVPAPSVVLLALLVAGLVAVVRRRSS